MCDNQSFYDVLIIYPGPNLNDGLTNLCSKTQNNVVFSRRGILVTTAAIPDTNKEVKTLFQLVDNEQSSPVIIYTNWWQSPTMINKCIQNV